MFDWDHHNLEHIANHDFEPDEVEEIFADPNNLGASAQNVGGEKRWALIGATEDDRISFVVYTKHKRVIRVVTAREAHPSEKRRYRKRRK